MAVMWMETVPGTGKMAAARHTDSKPRPPMTTSTSHIMDLLQFFFFFKTRDCQLKETMNMGNVERICPVTFPE